MIIEINHLYKKYDKDIIFEELNYRFDIDGSVTALLGPNGAGKTSFMKLISGILCPYRGEIIAKQDDEEKETYINWAHNNIAYLSPDERYLSFKNSAIDNILYYGVIKGVSNQIILDNLNDFMKYIDCKDYMHKRVEQLSTGQKKIVKVLSIFSTGLPVLLLDEPTVGLDVDTRDILIEMIDLLAKMTHSTVMVSTHDLEFASKVSNKQVFIYGGKIKKIQTGTWDMNISRDDYSTYCGKE